MRKSLSLRAIALTGALALVVLAATPAAAQLRGDAARLEASRGAARLTEGQDGRSFTLNRLFSPAHFQMRHTVEFSSSTWAGGGMSMGAYTNSLLWRFDRLDARVDVSVATPFGPSLGAQQGQPQVFLRNAELSYRPSASTELRFSVQQSPYGGYASPYGYAPLGTRAGLDVRDR